MSYAYVAAYIPEDLREVFTQPLPEWSRTEHHPEVKSVMTGYKTEDELLSSLVDRDLDKIYADLFNSVVALGELSLKPDEYFQANLSQGPPRMIGRGIRWHSDHGIHQGRLVVSNRLGTFYETVSGVQATPDFGILKLADTNRHAPNKDKSQTTKTRLIVSVYTSK